MRSANRPDAATAPMARNAPAICTHSTSAMERSENRANHDSGNTVTT